MNKKISLKINYLIYNFLWLSEQLFGTKKISWTQMREIFFNNYLLPATKAPNRFGPVEIRDIHFIDKDFIKNLPTDRPLVLRGLTEKTACLKSWNWDYLKKMMANTEQPYTDTFSGNSFNSGMKKTDELFENILSDRPQYSLMFGDILTKETRLLNDLETAKWIDLKAFSFKLNKSWKFFAAGKKRNTNLHCELGSGLIMQILGEKRWIIFSPKYSANIYPKISWKMYIESARFPDFSKARNEPLGIEGFEVLLKPGEVLYCPAYFWHFITNETAAVSISYKWTEPLSFLRHPFLSICVLTSRYPMAFFRLPVLKRFSKIHPPVG